MRIRYAHVPLLKGIERRKESCSSSVVVGKRNKDQRIKYNA